MIYFPSRGLISAQAERAMKRIYNAMDLNEDGRLFLSELAGWMQAVVHHHYEESEAESQQEFQRIG